MRYASPRDEEGAGTRVLVILAAVILAVILGAPGVLGQSQPALDGKIGIGFMNEKTSRKQGADQYIFTFPNRKPIALDLYQAAAIGGPVADWDSGGKKLVLLLAMGSNENWKKPHSAGKRWEAAGFVF